MLGKHKDQSCLYPLQQGSVCKLTPQIAMVSSARFDSKSAQIPQNYGAIPMQEGRAGSCFSAKSMDDI